MEKKKEQKFVIGTDGDDRLEGSSANQFLFGRSGNDVIFAGGGNDHVFGGRGGDLLFGEGKNDHLFGGWGNDALSGGDGNDKLDGGAGRDLLLGGAGHDQLDGGGNNDTYLVRVGTGSDTIKSFEAGDRIDIRDFHVGSFQAVLDAARQSGHDVKIDLGGGDKIILEDTQLTDLHPEQFIIASEIKGPSSSQSPYIVSTNPNVFTESLLTAGDSVGGYKMVGIPDGLGAFDNGDGTFTVLMNHELGRTAGAVRDHGAKGAFVSEWAIDKTTLQVVSGHDLMKHVWTYNPVTHAYEDHSAALGNGIAFDRFCSADLADQSAFFDSATGLGYSAGRIYLNGEESGMEGRAMAHIVGGAEDGNSYELAWLGNMAYENVVANSHTGNKTVVALTDDGPNGQVYFYVGDKQAAGSAIEKAGLTGGHLFGLKVDDFAASNNDAPNSTAPVGADDQSHFSLVDLGDVSGKTGAQVDAASESAGVASFLRPEDGAWDTIDHDRFYFVTTNAFNAPSQLWAADFNDAANPAAGGTLKLLLNGSEGQQMFDNITVDKSGKVILQEDVGNNAHLGKVWEYDPALDSLTQIAGHDPNRFLPGSANFVTQDEESSGVIDVTDILGNAGENVFLLDVQAHFTAGVPPDQVEGGQLLLMHEYLL